MSDDLDARMERIMRDFQRFNETRTCPKCGGSLRAYNKYDFVVLACLSCSWGVANDLVPPEGFLLVDAAEDRREHRALLEAFKVIQREQGEP